MMCMKTGMKAKSMALRDILPLSFEPKNLQLAKAGGGRMGRISIRSKEEFNSKYFKEAIMDESKRNKDGTVDLPKAPNVDITGKPMKVSSAPTKPDDGKRGNDWSNPKIVRRSA